jgi:choline dehydrogenase-like flavoprotein
MSYDLLIVGSGPVGSTYARVVSERLPQIRILMVDAGPVLTDPPGLNLKNLDDEGAVRRARELSEGPAVPEPAQTVRARPGTHLVEPGSAGMPAAAVSTCVGGMGAHWTCATPRPYGSERIPFIPSAELDAALAEAERLLATTTMAFAESPQGAAIRRRLATVFDDELPERRKVGILPVAARQLDGGRATWTGVDTILEPLLETERFELRAETLCRELHVDGTRVTAAVLEHRASGERETVEASAIVVAADALRTPQLLFASGIRPPAVGRHLTEHPFTFGVVVVDPALVPPLAATRGARRVDPVLSVITVPFSEQHPYHAQVMHVERIPFPLPGLEDLDAPAGLATMGWGFRKWPRPEDRVEFSDDRADAFGMPAPTIEYALTERELADQERALENLSRAGAALGAFPAGGEPRVMPQGSSLHYMGTTRMGAQDDGSSVCDTWSRVWGLDNLFVGGNGVIPTANACNPTLTSVALAVRSCERVTAALSS